MGVLKKISVTIFLVVLVLNLKAQNNAPELTAAEDSLKYYLDSMRTTKVEKRKFYWNNKLREKLKTTLELDGAMEYGFDKLQSMGKMISPDKYFRIFNWNIENADMTHSYFGYILVPSNKKAKVIELLDKSAAIEKPETQGLNNQRWYGCLYYKIIVSDAKGKNEYTLLGFDMNTRASKKRIIEILSFSGDKANFGEAIFNFSDKTARKRVVFEYSAEVQMTLRWEENNQRIVFDHLIPLSPDAEGLYEFYVPDGSYDALVLENGRWRLEQDVDARGDKSKNDKNFNDPVKEGNPYSPPPKK